MSAASAGAPADPPPWTGPWADDARRLFQLLQTAAEQAATDGRAGAGRTDGGAGAGRADSTDGRAEHEHPPECRYCPFCQGVALLRRAGPEVLDQVAEFAAGLAATLRATQPGPDPAEPDPAGADSSGPDPAGPGSSVPQGAGTGGAESPPAGSAERSAATGTSTAARPPSTVRIDVTD